MTRNDFEYHIKQLVQDARLLGHYQAGHMTNVDESIESCERSIQYHRDELTKFYDRHQEDE